MALERPHERCVSSSQRLEQSHGQSTTLTFAASASPAPACSASCGASFAATASAGRAPTSFEEAMDFTLQAARGAAVGALCQVDKCIA
jgi:hypothetical protein